MLKVLPFTGIFAIAKGIVHFLQWELWEFDALMAALLSATTFAIALVLSNTLGDYRVSETLPMQIANALYTIDDTAQTLSHTFPNYPPAPLRSTLANIAQQILDWLQQQGDFEKIMPAIDQLNPFFAEMLQLGGTAPIVSRLQTEQAKLRGTIWQMQGIRDTDFLPPAYILLWLFLSGATLAILLIEVAHFSENLIISSLLFTSLLYLLLLIQDLDNPFEYEGKSYVDVDLALLNQTVERFNLKSSN